jgi:hypothetical protein
MIYGVTTPHTIRTAKGLLFRFDRPTPDMIDIDDIAGALSRIQRFGGHADRFISVAEHSVSVSTELLDGRGITDLRLQGLMHDAAEAYVGDVVSPLKAMLPDFRRIEEAVWAAIAKRFSLPLELSSWVKVADMAALKREAELLRPDTFPGEATRASCWAYEYGWLAPSEAKSLFLKRFEELTK